MFSGQLLVVKKEIKTKQNKVEKAAEALVITTSSLPQKVHSLSKTPKELQFQDQKSPQMDLSVIYELLNCNDPLVLYTLQHLLLGVWVIITHGVVLDNQSIVVGWTEFSDWTSASELYLLSNQRDNF